MRLTRILIVLAGSLMVSAAQADPLTVTGFGGTNFSYSTHATAGGNSTTDDHPTNGFAPPLSFAYTSTSTEPGTDAAQATLNFTANGGFAPGSDTQFGVTFNIQESESGSGVGSGSGANVFGRLYFSSPSPISIDLDYDLFSDAYGGTKVQIKDDGGDQLFLAITENRDGSNIGTGHINVAPGTYYIEIGSNSGDQTSNTGDYTTAHDHASMAATVTLTAVPEPGTMMISGLACLGLLGRRRRLGGLRQVR